MKDFNDKAKGFNNCNKRKRNDKVPNKCVISKMKKGKVDRLNSGKDSKDLSETSDCEKYEDN